MLFMSSSPMQLKTIHVLVITHPQNMKSPFVEQSLSLITKQTKQVIGVGNHILTQGRLSTFDAVVIPNVDDYLWSDMLARLKQHYSELLKEYAANQDKQLIVYGNAMQFLPPKILKIPRTEHIKRAQIIHGTQGLGIVPWRLDIDFDPERVPKQYLAELQRFSIESPIYLFDSTVMYSPEFGVRNGNVYLSTKKGVKQVAEIIMPKTASDKDALNERKIPPARAIYAQESETEKAKEEVGKAVHRNEKAIIRNN